VNDTDYMARALFLAARGLGSTSPNPVVGAVVVSADGVVVGQGYHARAGEAHAEVHALEMAGEQARGATLYCSLEPCCHTGRTGPCVERIADAGIVRVVAAVEDPNPKVCGRGFAYLRSRGIVVDVGEGRDAATRLNEPFFTLMRRARPFVTLKAAVSVDGGMAEAPGRRTQLTSDAANRHAQRVRAEIDAVAVGIETLLVDDPLLTPRGAYRARPLTRIVFDRRLRTPPDARLLSTLDVGPVMIVTTEAGVSQRVVRDRLAAAGADILVADGTVRSALEALATRGISALLIEGGPTLHQAAWDERLVDFVRLYVTPHVLGPAAIKFLEGVGVANLPWTDPRIEPLGPDILMEGYVHGAR
jgi:diaminohydroxyphosphoribosylaminopyrimidine deaminase / 5-amino-6-(5-phosphoribosylamino)uracil reductase